MDTSGSWQKSLEHIHKRPAMYFGNTDHPFTSLCAFLIGYDIGYVAAQRSFGTPEELVPADFSRFVTEYYGHTFPAGGKGWNTFITAAPDHQSLPETLQTALIAQVETGRGCKPLTAGLEGRQFASQNKIFESLVFFGRLDGLDGISENALLLTIGWNFS